MPDIDETNRLLTEIRDILVSREQAYRDQLDASNKLYSDKIEEWRRQARRWTLIQWAGIAVLVYGAVALAMSR